MFKDPTILPDAGLHRSWRLPRRDYVLLPLIFLTTILILLAGGEIIARWMYVEEADSEPCEYLTTEGFRYHPNCTSHTKVWEGPWITQHFNECGYRSAESCAPRSPRALRVVVIGSSTSRGALVNYSDSFAGHAEETMSKRCGGRVDFQNLGSEPPDVNRIDQRMSEVLGLHPAAIIVMIGPFDLSHLTDPPPIPGRPVPPRPQKPGNLHYVITLVHESRLFEILEYYLYRDPAFHARAVLLNGERADYMRTPLSATWEQHVANLGKLMARIAARSDGVPILLLYVPEHAQVALAKQTAKPAEIDPYALGEALQKVTAPYGIRFFDTTSALASAPDFRSLFYVTEGHAKAGGHTVMATIVENALLAEPAFARCTAP